MEYDVILQRKLESMFNDDSVRSRFCEELDRHGIESGRVSLAILKIAGSDLKEIRVQANVAKVDYRDVLAYAEYPNQMKAGLKISAEEEKQLIELDKQQYEEWLEE